MPYANRIAHGILANGVRLALGQDEVHGLHGVGWKRAWRVVHAHDHGIRLELSHGADGSWPYDFVATLDIDLSENTLSQRLHVSNTGTQHMPTGLGLHPNFPIDKVTRLETSWGGVWEPAADEPPREHRTAAAPDLIVPDQLTVNHCFTGWGRRATLRYEGYAVTLDADTGNDFVQIYQPGPGSGFISIEPVTHVPYAHQLENDSSHRTGLRWLAPGDSQAISMVLAAE